MPKSIIQAPVKTPPANYLTDLFVRYMQANKITQAKLGEMLGCTHANISAMMQRSAGKWRVEDIVSVCNALQCPVGDATDAVLRSVGATK